MTAGRYSTSRVDPRVIRAALVDAQTMSYREVARRHGLHHTTLRQWVTSRADQPAWPTDDDIAAWDTAQSRRCDYRLRRHLAGGPLMVDSTGTHRRLRALYAIGHTSWDIAAAMGVPRHTVTDLVKGQHDSVERRTADAVARVYDAMSMTVPRDDDGPRRRGSVRVHDRQRRESAAKGWIVPLAWDDIDDPDETPTTGTDPWGSGADDLDPVVVQRVLDGDYRIRATRAEKLAAADAWTARGGSLDDLERLTGWNVFRMRRTAARLAAEAARDDDGEVSAA